MNDLVRNFAWYMDHRGPVLEVGSYIEEHQDHLDLRRAFPRGTPYVGIDALTGPGVDRQVNLLDDGQMASILTEVSPKLILCLYVLEHVWEIQKAVNTLGDAWRRFPDSWLWAGTHQMQPYHGTGQYPDFWRVTAQGLKRLMDEAAVHGARVFTHPNTSNPTDVLAIRQPSSLTWPEAVFTNILKATSSRWEQYC